MTSTDSSTFRGFLATLGEAMKSYDFLSGKSRIPHADPTRKGTLLESKKNT
jgi:hypothetical protein